MVKKKKSVGNKRETKKICWKLLKKETFIKKKNSGALTMKKEQKRGRGEKKGGAPSRFW